MFYSRILFPQRSTGGNIFLHASVFGLKNSHSALEAAKDVLVLCIDSDVDNAKNRGHLIVLSNSVYKATHDRLSYYHLV
jgi:hypothetical protein